MALTLRLTTTLHARSLAQAERTGLSLNKLVAIALDDYLSIREDYLQPQAAPAPLPASPAPATRVPSSHIAPAIRSTRSKPARARSQWIKLGRNAICPCGSGMKFKKCCLSKQAITGAGR